MKLAFIVCNCCKFSGDWWIWGNQILSSKATNVIGAVGKKLPELDAKLLAGSNKIRCMCCSGLSPSSGAVDLCQQKHELWHKQKKCWELVWESMKLVNFSS